jgi:protocatechuate 3,4-dioxygenase beta subunit
VFALLVLTLIGLLWTSPSIALESKDEVLVNCRKVTSKVISNPALPGKMPHSNNLRSKPGGVVTAQGEPITLTGKVVDEYCVPVQGAVVELWHADAKGRYQAHDPLFQGAGKATTSNMGRYEFLTIFPGSTPPRMHIRVRHPNFKTLETTVFFSGHVNPGTVPSDLVAKLEPVDPTNPQLGRTAEFIIVMPGRERYRDF